MAQLLACPFCRALARSDEASSLAAAALQADGSTRCAECGVELVPFGRLSPDPYDDAEPTGPREDALGWRASARAALLGLAALGLALFFAPWVRLDAPESALLSGFELARGPAPWLWGGAVGNFVLVPLLASRRTVAQARGVRVIAALLASVTLVQALALWFLVPPRSVGPLPFAFQWSWALFASALSSLAATVTATRLGRD